ncbi:MAG: HD domain-containing protein [Acidobacteriota bacterium]|nr:HD domain-containing protein [Acidobacteriota bacterium]MDH3784830.1 HD domain-containing protein [Acidobacteriota bacterium]
MSGSAKTDDSKPAFRRRGRIVYTLAAVLVLVGLAPLTAVAWKLIDENRYALTTAQQEFQLLLARSIAREIDIHVDGAAAEVIRVAQGLGGTTGRGGLQSRAIRNTLNDVVDERLIFLRFAYFDSASVRAIDAGILDEKLEPSFESGLRDAVEDLGARGSVPTMQATISDPIRLGPHDGSAVIVVSAPVVTRGKFRGVISGVVDLQGIWDSVVSTTDTGHLTYAIDDSGEVFASTDTVAVRPGRAAEDSPLVQRFLASKGRGSVTMEFSAKGMSDGAMQLGSYEVTRDGWGVFVQARLDDVYHPVQSMIDNTMRWALVVLALSIIAAMAFAGTLSTPINRLANASRKFAEGDFSSRVQVRSGNEIGELAFTFNRMAGEIEDQIRRLKQAADENAELFLGTIRALAQAIDAKDPYTRGHSGRVNRYSVLIAKEVGLSEEDVRDIHVASLMHDVGKIGVNDKILQKPGKLTPEEFEVMKTHTTLGASIMAPIRQMKRVLPGLRSHHERWQGGGYPDGQVGEDIPLMARIIAVADTFDAMTTHRPYQRAMTFEEAHDRINKLRGVAFEARIVEAFNRVYARGVIRSEDLLADEGAAAIDADDHATERDSPATV